MAWWAVVSPFTPYGPTIALVFVLLVAATKAAAEDRKRHAEDRRTNNSAAHVVQADGAPQSCSKRVLGAEVACRMSAHASALLRQALCLDG